MTGVKTEHGKRVAYLSYLMGRNYGLSGNELVEFVGCAILASRHHEKLDGSGYPFGLKEENLSFDEKLLTCIDIYQALTESRPYKDDFSHEKTIAIMNEVVEKKSAG